MFDMHEVGRRIAVRRKERNMTQMSLADAMGVSFQAVSNWERGNSMPDIGKLPELAGILDLSIDELLTDEKPAQLIRHIIKGDERAYIEEEDVRPETVAEVAPILPPEKTESLIDEVIGHGAKESSLHDLISLAPYVSGSFLDQWVTSVATYDSLSDLAGLAPFLSVHALDTIVDRFTGESVRIKELTGLAPFLSSETMEKLVSRSVEDGNIGELTGLAPFLSEEALDRLAHTLLEGKSLSIKKIVGLAPFLSKETIDWLAKKAMDDATAGDLAAIAPFLSQDTLQECAKVIIEKEGLKGILPIVPFL